MKGKGRRKIRKARENEERLEKQASQHEKKRMAKTERWSGGIRPASYGKPPLKTSYAPKYSGLFNKIEWK